MVLIHVTRVRIPSGSLDLFFEQFNNKKQPKIKEIEMIERYKKPKIEQVWSDPEKLRLWQETELAVIKARVSLGQMSEDAYNEISELLHSNPIDIIWWLKREEETRHDLNAFLDERLRFLPESLQPHFHDGMTSYDTEEPAFASMIKSSISVLEEQLQPLLETVKSMARNYRYTVMNGRTHGQEAELQSFGKRCLTWLVVLMEDINNLTRTKESLQYSKLSGAIGNYRGLSPEVEAEALRILGFKPFYGATQIMPRELYAPIAQAVCQIVLTLHKIAIDIRLGARSGRPIYQEPFGKKQKGSSAMPHKKNTISCEQLEGMARMAKGFSQTITDNISTWEERAIEQSSVERVAWPDLFHIAVHSVKTMTRVLQGLVVYPDNMLAEIIDSYGCYATGEAKEFLRHHGHVVGISTEDAYRIVQLAAFNVFETKGERKEMRQNPATSFAVAEKMFLNLILLDTNEPFSIREIIEGGCLVVSDQLAANQGTVDRWNNLLRKLFGVVDIQSEWQRIFTFSYLLAGENTLYREILGE